MCGRFNVSNTPGLQAMLDSLGVHVRLPAATNIAPTESISLLRALQSEQPEMLEARWWLTPSWSKGPSQKYAMFNARCETLGKSPAFRKPFASQRGLVPMSSFIEWRGSAGEKQPWLISNSDEALAVAALWDLWSDGQSELLSCTLVTTDAAPEFRPWHHRMPVLLAVEDRERWLDNSQKIADDDAVFAATLREPLLLTPIDRAAGNARNKAPELMQPAGDTVRLQPHSVSA